MQAGVQTNKAEDLTSDGFNVTARHSSYLVTKMWRDGSRRGTDGASFTYFVCLYEISKGTARMQS